MEYVAEASCSDAGGELEPGVKGRFRGPSRLAEYEYVLANMRLLIVDEA